MHGRAAALLVLALLALPTAAAQDARSIPPPGTVWTVLTTVQATVQDNYATVQVIADIGNRGPDPEFPFQVRIPDDAFVTGLTIERDGKTYEAQIKAREDARDEYEDWKAQGQTGGLVEKARRSSVYAYLINVAEFTSVRATLTYERYLYAERGVYNLSLEAPVSGFGQDLGARFDVTVRHRDGVSAAWGIPTASVVREAGGWHVSHAVGARPDDASTPFEVAYSLAPTKEGGSLVTTVIDGTGYFAHRFRASASERQMPVDLVLVLDVSGSMSGLKFEQMKDSAVQVLQQLNADDRLHVGFFSSDATAPWAGLRSMDAANRKAASDEINSALVAGGTNLEAALNHGFEALEGIDWREEEGRLPVLVILTDGQPTVGQTDRARLRQLALDANEHDVNVFAIAFGADADWSFVHGIAADGNGTALRVPEGVGAEVDIRRFMDALTTPVLKDVRIAYGSGVTSYRTTAPILFAGSELLVVGTFDPAKGMPAATVRAVTPEGAREWTVEPEEGSAISFLPRIVSYQRILQIQQTIDAEGERVEWANEIKGLAVKHGFVTDYTSLVVTLEPRDARAQPQNVTLVMNDAGADGGAWDVQGNGFATGGAPASTSPTSARIGLGGLSQADSGRSVPTPTTTATGPAPGTPTPKVPGPELALVLAVLGAAAVALARRRR